MSTNININVYPPPQPPQAQTLPSPSNTIYDDMSQIMADYRQQQHISQYQNMNNSNIVYPQQQHQSQYQPPPQVPLQFHCPHCYGYFASWASLKTHIGCIHC